MLAGGVFVWSLATALVPLTAGFLPGLYLCRLLVSSPTLAILWDMCKPLQAGCFFNDCFCHLLVRELRDPSMQDLDQRGLSKGSVMSTHMQLVERLPFLRTSFFTARRMLPCGLTCGALRRWAWGRACRRRPPRIWSPKQCPQGRGPVRWPLCLAASTWAALPGEATWRSKAHFGERRRPSSSGMYPL